MKATDAHQSNANAQRGENRKPYSPPGFRRLAPAEAKELLLQRADPRDPVVRQMLDCIDGLPGKKNA